MVIEARTGLPGESHSGNLEVVPERDEPGLPRWSGRRLDARTRSVSGSKPERIALADASAWKSEGGACRGGCGSAVSEVALSPYLSGGNCAPKQMAKTGVWWKRGFGGWRECLGKKFVLNKTHVLVDIEHVRFMTRRTHADLEIRRAWVRSVEQD